MPFLPPNQQRQSTEGNCSHTYQQFLKMNVSVGLGLVFVRLLRFSILCIFCFSLDFFVLVLFAFVVLSLVSSVLR